MVYFYSATSSSQVTQKYEATLTPEQKARYKEVVSERSRLAYEGYGIGFIIAALYIWLHRSFLTGATGRLFKRDKLSSISMVCIVVSLMFVTNYFYYVLSPKKSYMLNYLNEKEEIANWVTMYREMQFNYHLGLLFGIIAAGIGAFAFRC